MRRFHGLLMSEAQRKATAKALLIAQRRGPWLMRAVKVRKRRLIEIIVQGEQRVRIAEDGKAS